MRWSVGLAVVLVSCGGLETWHPFYQRHAQPFSGEFSGLITRTTVCGNETYAAPELFLVELEGEADGTVLIQLPDCRNVEGSRTERLVEVERHSCPAHDFDQRGPWSRTYTGTLTLQDQKTLVIELFTVVVAGGILLCTEHLGGTLTRD